MAGAEQQTQAGLAGHGVFGAFSLTDSQSYVAFQKYIYTSVVMLVYARVITGVFNE